MDVSPDVAAALQQWLLSEAPPVQRCYFLTALGRLPPRPLGAALFEGLLAAGRPQCALRLVRHAGALSDERLAALARQHLVHEQEAREAAPTWRRQAWKRLAVARPALALQLMAELWAKVEASGDHDGLTATTMVGACRPRGLPGWMPAVQTWWPVLLCLLPGTATRHVQGLA